MLKISNSGLENIKKGILAPANTSISIKISTCELTCILYLNLSVNFESVLQLNCGRDDGINR